MRIISQKGQPRIDLPYDRVAISIRNVDGWREIMATSLCNDKYWVMASYSSIEKARKVMDLLAEAYAASTVFKTLTTEECCAMLSITPKYQMKHLYGIFTFPTEDELDEIIEEEEEYNKEKEKIRLEEEENEE